MLLIAVICSGVVVGCGGSDDGQNFARSELAELTVTNEIVFPRVAIGETAVQRFRIENTGSGELEIRNIKLEETDGDETRELELGDNWFDKKTIASGESVGLRLEYSPADPNTTEGKIRLKSNSRTANSRGIDTVDIRALNIGPQISSKRKIQFGQVGPGGKSSKVLEIENVGQTTLKIDDMFLNRSGSSAFQLSYPDPDSSEPDDDLDEPPTSTLDPEETLKIRIWFEPTTRQAAKNELIIASNAQNQSTYSVDIQGNTSGPCVSLSPSDELAFEPTLVGSTGVKSGTITNCSTDSTLEISNVELEGAGAEAFILKTDSLPGQLPDGTATVSPGQQVHFQIEFQPRAEQEYEASLAVDSDDATRPTAKVRLTGEGTNERYPDGPETTGDIEPVPTSDVTDVRPNHTEGNRTIYFFREKQGYELSEPLHADFGGTGVINHQGGSPMQPGVVIEGETVNSYYLHYDQRGDVGQTPVNGSFSFQNKILGVIVSTGRLDDSNQVLTNCELEEQGKCVGEDVIYPVKRSIHKAFALEGHDRVSVSADRQTLFLDLITKGNCDNIRVITEAD